MDYSADLDCLHSYQPRVRISRFGLCVEVHNHTGEVLVKCYTCANSAQKTFENQIQKIESWAWVCKIKETIVNKLDSCEKYSEKIDWHGV